MTLDRLPPFACLFPDLNDARGFYRDQLGLTEAFADTHVLVFNTGTADLVVEAADPTDAEEKALIGRFVGVSFAVPGYSRRSRRAHRQGRAFRLRAGKTALGRGVGARFWTRQIMC